MLEGCGFIAADKYEDLIKVIVELQASSLKDREGGIKGFQHTPSFMLAVLKDAITQCISQKPCEERTYAEGGYTDVGQHTGGQPLDTCWPLVRALFQVWS